MAEWLYEAGIGENRAALVENGSIVEAQIELPGLRVGTVADAQLTSILVPGRRGIATLGDGSEVLIEPLPKITEGAAVRIEIVREAIVEPGAIKRAKGRISEADIRAGPDLAVRIGAHRTIGPHGPDEFEAAGWSECLEEAASGIIAFGGGKLRISLTPAMTLLDVDGDDAIAAADAVGRAIRRLGIAGNIGIDFPTVAGKAERRAIGAALDTALPPPFERTAVNGFGLLQIIRPRVRASLCELLHYDRVGASARALIRRAQRSGLVGTCEIAAHPQVIAKFEQTPRWTEQLQNQLGGLLTLRGDREISMDAGVLNRIG